jgi:hypothetical protein
MSKTTTVPAPPAPKMFRVTSVAAKGAKPHVSRVFAADAKAAAAKAIADHRAKIVKDRKLKVHPNTIAITTLSTVEVPLTTLPKPKLNF